MFVFALFNHPIVNIYNIMIDLELTGSLVRIIRKIVTIIFRLISGKWHLNSSENYFSLRGTKRRNPQSDLNIALAR